VYARHGGANQQWEWDPASKAIFCPHNSKALDIEGGVGGKRVLAWGRHGGANQQWDLVPLVPAPGAVLVYGATVKLQHVRTGSRLHSHPSVFPGGSRQQQVTCFGGSDANDWWLVKAAHNEGQPAGGGAVAEGAIVRFEHVETKRNLHSHDIRSPVTKQTEVSCFGDHGNGDSNCNWRVLYGQEGDALRLQHVNMAAQRGNGGHFLHSHGNKLPRWGWGQQEVTVFGGKDANDLWRIQELRSPLGGAVAAQQQDATVAQLLSTLPDIVGSLSALASGGAKSHRSPSRYATHVCLMLPFVLDP
jgi:hypothetical protein